MALDPKNVKPGEEQHEKYYLSVLKKHLVQYDYRDIDGELFSCSAHTLEKAKQKRDEWLIRKYEAEMDQDIIEEENEDELDFEP